MEQQQKHPALIVRQADPLNAGPPPELLGASAVTPTDQFFVRTHGSIPHLDPATFTLRVAGLVQTPLVLSLAALRALGPWTETTATIVCAGMRRAELQAYQPTPGELMWGPEAVSTGVWGGIRLRDLLARCALDPAAAHVGFVGLDSVERLGERFGFGGSIPLERALEADVLLALELNGAPLPAIHGAPLRAVVPGYLGARSVKWLGQIELLAEPSANYFQRRAYRAWRSGDPAAQLDLAGVPPLGELPVNAVICAPPDGSSVPAGPCQISGFAIGGGGRAVRQVELSADAGASWTAAVVDQAPAGAWHLWRATLDLAAGEHRILVRAIDETGATQPSDIAQVWNVKGYYNNAWHQVALRAVLT